MKKLALALCAILFSATTSFAGNADLFKYNEAELDASLAELELIEEIVLADENATYENLLISNADLVANLSSQPSISEATQSEPPLGIPSFVWGCVFGIAGLAVVYFVTEDSDETKKALWGCIASTVVGLVLYFAVFAAAVGGAASGI